MKKDMLGAVVRKLVEIPSEMLGAIYDFLEKLLGSESQEWLAEFKKFLRKEKYWTGVMAETLLELISTVTMPARLEKFVAKNHFIVDTSRKAKVKIDYLGDNFRNNFLNKIEEAISEIEFRYQKLKKHSRDIPIINELGGDEKAETMLSVIFDLMKMQPNGENGPLITNGYANIFYARDIAGVLWAVHCRWYGGGWGVSAHSVDSPSDWRDGSQVFSRNS
ncbi:MAG: hypothetical protein AAB504_01645 [Patescibacteria group bacterium]|mgnify:CR=1 FL=1